MLRACTVYREGLYEDRTRRSEGWHSPAKERIFYIPDCLQRMDRIAAAKHMWHCFLTGDRRRFECCGFGMQCKPFREVAPGYDGFHGIDEQVPVCGVRMDS